MSVENGKVYSRSPFRNRVYERTFDWNLAREMYRAGLTFAEIARRLGVDRRGVARVCHMPESRVREATAEEIALAFQFRDRIPCPRCGAPMTSSASLCASCRHETRLLPMTLRTRPGTAGRSRVELRAVEIGRIVEIDGEYGVVVRNPGGWRHGYRCVDLWFDGPTLVGDRVRVRVLPSKEVLVGGVPQETEEIALDE